jgi:glycosyltransferase involved in cell wall biosynthesis/GT2 family glycosyltransferase
VFVARCAADRKEPMISVVIPVLNGARHLDELLTAVTGQVIDEPFEVLVIDSGSTDGSLRIVAGHHGVRLIEIPPDEFGHGRTRNLGVQQTSGELIAFLTQDATPASEHWLASYRDAFRLADNVGAAFGPHLPRDGVSPLMARLLKDHFDSFGSQGGETVLQAAGDSAYLSNSNSCISRTAWEAAPFREIPYAEDQAFGVDVLKNGFLKAYVPGAAALHSHDYPMVESFKRYFDEYRGLSDSIGEKTEASASKALEIIGDSVTRDREFLAELGQPAWRQAAWSARSAIYHTGRVGFGGLGARAGRLPGRVRQVLSFEGRDDGVSFEIPPSGEGEFASVAEVEREGIIPLAPRAGAGPLHVAWVVPAFGIGGGGHTTIFRMVRALERAGHRCSIWVHDPAGIDPVSAGTMRKRIRDHYFEIDAPVHSGFADWSGADVAMATGWDTVYKVLRLDQTGARAYFVQDHEPEFYATSARALFAEQSYRAGLPCICASPWLAELMRDRYGAQATAFTLGADTDHYKPVGAPRRNDTIAFYARSFTERRGVELGVMALAEVVRRRPGTRVALYGTNAMVQAPFPYQHVGIVSPERLARLYSEATVGLSLSLTNYSLIPLEMMACGLPVVELSGRACEGVFGDDDALISLADDNPNAIADRLLELLDDDELRDRRSEDALAFARANTWDVGTGVVVDAIERIAAGTPQPQAWAAGSLI